jgi:HD-GYP domain-containing protein (c-di-GMP phosphodiesterase class II)
VDAALELPMSPPDDSTDGDLWQTVLAQEPKPRVTVSGTGLMRALAALGDYADLKVPERSGRARRVAHLAAAAAATADFDSTDTSTLVHAALVHDLGVVAIPIQVLRASPHPGSAGWEQWRLHPHWTARVLARCSGLEKVAHAAGQHHERSDGSGYPTGLAGNQGRVAGVLACAVLYDELTTDTGASVEGAATGLRELAKRGGLDPRDVNAVLGGVGTVPGPRGRTPRWPAALTDREVDVLRMLAQGLTNRQIATRLGISIKTVGTHVEHVYDKAGVRSRAAATLFAMQRELVG